MSVYQMFSRLIDIVYQIHGNLHSFMQSNEPNELKKKKQSELGFCIAIHIVKLN